MYGRRSPIIPRQALHAFRLTLPHPRDHAAITFVAPVPGDVVRAWQALGGAWPPPDDPEF